MKVERVGFVTYAAEQTRRAMNVEVSVLALVVVDVEATWDKGNAG